MPFIQFLCRFFSGFGTPSNVTQTCVENRSPAHLHQGCYDDLFLLSSIKVFSLVSGLDSSLIHSLIDLFLCPLVPVLMLQPTNHIEIVAPLNPFLCWTEAIPHSKSDSVLQPGSYQSCCDVYLVNCKIQCTSLD